jgi:tetratricopeptide (TPR) repeat protein
MWDRTDIRMPGGRDVNNSNRSYPSREEEATELLQIGELDGALFIADAEIENTGSNGVVLWQFEFIRTEVWRIKGRADQAYHRLESLSSQNPQDIEILASLRMHYGYCAAMLGKHDQARGLLDEALHLALSNGLSDLEVKIKIRMAFLSFLREEYDTAGCIYRDIVDSIGDRYGWAMYSGALSGVGKIEMTLKRFTEAIPWFEHSTKIAQAHGARLLIAKNWGELAVCYLGLGDPKKSIEFLDKSDSIFLSAGAMHWYQVNVADRGNVHLYLGDYPGAISYYMRALELARNIKDPVSVGKWSGNLKIAYTEMIRSMKATGS